MGTGPRPSESAENFISAMGMAATGVSVVTTEGSAGRYGLTVSAVSSVSADPPMVLVCINRKSPAAGAAKANGVFAVNLLADHDRSIAETFAGRPAAGKPYDFENQRWVSGRTGMPLLEEAVAAFECELQESHEAGSHVILIGRVIAAHRGSAEPLIYCNRAFRRIASH